MYRVFRSRVNKNSRTCHSSVLLLAHHTRLCGRQSNGPRRNSSSTKLSPAFLPPGPVHYGTKGGEAPSFHSRVHLSGRGRELQGVSVEKFADHRPLLPENVARAALVVCGDSLPGNDALRESETVREGGNAGVIGSVLSVDSHAGLGTNFLVEAPNAACEPV